jgi:CheY-like chemotaxis protein
MKFLIVDDSPAMQTIIRRSLEKAGYEDNDFKMAEDGNVALDLIREWEPDLVLTDWHMPNMTGLELLQKMKQQMLDFKVGLITTETDPKCIVQAKEAGALFVLHKPFELTEFQRTILPIVQGSVEGENLLTNHDSKDDLTQYELQLPSLASLSKILDGFTVKDITLDKVKPGEIDYSKLPYVMALFNDHEQDVIKAICIMDINAAVILGCAFDNESSDVFKKTLKSKSLNKKHLDNNKRLLKMVSALFYNPVNQQNLDLKSVHTIAKPFDRLDKLGATSADKRIDITLSAKDYGEGQMILMAVAE